MASISVLKVTYQVSGIIAQTFFYGVYASLIPFSTYFMLKKGLHTNIRKFLFAATLFMFMVSTVYWGFKINDLMTDIGRLFAGEPDDRGSLVTIFAAFALVNYLLTDGVVIWRSWVLCSMETRSRKMLYFPIFFLGCCCCTVAATIGIRIAIEAHSLDSPRRPKLIRAIDICQVGNLLFSLIVNLSTTIIIALKTWRFRRWVLDDLQAIRVRKKAGAERILALLVESGLLYCFSGATALAGTLIRLPHGTLGDLYTPVNIQIAGIYPVLVLLLVNRGQSLERTVFNHTGHHSTSASGSSEELDTMQFRMRSAMARPERTELSLRLSQSRVEENSTYGRKGNDSLSANGHPYSPIKQ